MQRAEKLKIHMPCTVKTDAEGHERRAVALTSTAPKGKMEAQNSWGGDNKNWPVDRDDFISAITFDPIITKAMKSRGVGGGAKEIDVPQPQEFYTERLQEYEEGRAREAAEEQAKREREAKEAQEARERIAQNAAAAVTKAQRAQKRLQSGLVTDLLKIVTDQASKMAVTKTIQGLVHGQMEKLDLNEFSIMVSDGRHGLEVFTVLAEAIAYSSSLTSLRGWKGRNFRVVAVPGMRFVRVSSTVCPGSTE